MSVSSSSENIRHYNFCKEVNIQIWLLSNKQKAEQKKTTNKAVLVPILVGFHNTYNAVTCVRYSYTSLQLVHQ